jgi:Asp-tRNA(Asn)/Glu-tRNA(Gln) amidotransferase A subunit family amidase
VLPVRFPTEATPLDAAKPNLEIRITDLDTPVGNTTIIVPAGYQILNNKKPLGLSFLAKAYEEDRLIGYAYDF